MKHNSILLCLLFAITANSFTTAKAQVNVNDSLALVDLYNSTNGPNWINNYNWLTANPVSTWLGITVTGSRVVSIKLFGYNLNGTIPASIGNLTALTDLNLADNRLTGAIPAAIGNITTLTYLTFNINQLSGTIPAEIGNLTNLTYLGLSTNQLSGAIPAEIGNLTILTALQLNINQLSGTIPAQIGNLTNLTFIDLDDNQLTGTIPAFLGNLTKLEQLYLNNNQLSGTIPAEIGNLTNLAALGLGGNQLTGTIPAFIGNLTHLYGLYLNDNGLTGTITAEISNLTNLTALDLSTNQLTGTIPSTLGNLTHLGDLYLQSNQLTGAIPASLGNLTKLNYLRLNNNHLSGAIPSSLGNLKKLENLSLDSNQLTGAVPASFHKLTRLNFLDISHNLLSTFGYTSTALSINSKISGSVSNNLFTFDELQFIAKNYRKIVYAPQDTILPIHQSGGSLSVYAGGTLSNNTYKWFKKGTASYTTITGDSAFHPTQGGKYYAQITNAVATQLTLNTDTIPYTVLLAKASFGADAVVATHVVTYFSVYPNPAKDIIHIQTNGTAILTLTNNAGKVLFTKTINNSDAINISQFANGTYYLQNKTTGEVQKIVVAH